MFIAALSINQDQKITQVPIKRIDTQIGVQVSSGTLQSNSKERAAGLCSHVAEEFRDCNTKVTGSKGLYTLNHSCQHFQDSEGTESQNSGYH